MGKTKKEYTICWVVEYERVQKIKADSLTDAISKSESSFDTLKDLSKQKFFLSGKRVYDFTRLNEMKESKE
tara:strand:+ start:2303 stop:2515 length:213 start_codon:yes stop_codon:yes gene_type:complete